MLKRLKQGKDWVIFWYEIQGLYKRSSVYSVFVYDDDRIDIMDDDIFSFESIIDNFYCNDHSYFYMFDYDL